MMAKFVFGRRAWGIVLARRCWWLIVLLTALQVSPAAWGAATELRPATLRPAHALVSHPPQAALPALHGRASHRAADPAALILPSVDYSHQALVLVAGVPSPAAAVLQQISLPSILPVLRLAPLDRRQQTLCLALVIYQEARGQSVAEQIAVAQVVINRTLQSASSICAVIWADHGSQFQWTRRATAAILPQEDAVWQATQTLARQLISRRPVDHTHGATNFFNPDLSDPLWATRGTVTARFTQVFLRFDRR